LLVLASDCVEKVSFLYVCNIFKLKEMKNNVKQNAVKRQDKVGNVSFNQCLFFFFIYKNKLWTVVYRTQNINKLGKICENLFMPSLRVTNSNRLICLSVRSFFVRSIRVKSCRFFFLTIIINIWRDILKYCN